MKKEVMALEEWLKEYHPAIHAKYKWYVNDLTKGA